MSSSMKPGPVPRAPGSRAHMKEGLCGGGGQIRIIRVQRSRRAELGERRILRDVGWAEVCAPASSGPGRNTEGTICCGEVPHSPQCGTTPAFQLKCILRRERHNPRIGCKHRTINIDDYKDLRHIPTGMHAVAQAHHLACHPTRYNPSPLSPPARSNPFRYITSAR